MEAELVAELPDGDGWQYEPKWDGFRGVLENDGGELALWSRNGRPLLRYFPELRELGELLPPALRARRRDRDRARRRARLRRDADAPASGREPRPEALGGDPGDFVAFDLLLWDGEPVHELPLEERRAELERVAEGFAPLPRDARRRAGARRGSTASGRRLRRRRREEARPPVPPRLARRRRQGQAAQDGGLRRHRHALEGEADATIATLLLGLYRDDGEIDYVGSAAVGAKAHAEIPGACCRCSTTRPDRGFSEPNRWGTGELEQSALRPELVVEVRYDKLEKRRFRHGTQLLRFRDDKDPEDCTWREVRPPRRRTT